MVFSCAVSEKRYVNQNAIIILMRARVYMLKCLSFIKSCICLKICSTSCIKKIDVQTQNDVFHLTLSSFVVDRFRNELLLLSSSISFIANRM